MCKKRRGHRWHLLLGCTVYTSFVALRFFSERAVLISRGPFQRAWVRGNGPLGKHANLAPVGGYLTLNVAHGCWQSTQSRFRDGLAALNAGTVCAFIHASQCGLDRVDLFIQVRRLGLQDILLGRIASHVTQVGAGHPFVRL